MKLLSRFIWLIIAILVLVFGIVTLFQVRATNELEVIKESIKDEYDIQVDKMIEPDKFGTGFSAYMNDIASDASTAIFLSEQSPDPYFTDINLHEEILKYNDVDALWFFKPDNSLFVFKNVQQFTREDAPIPANSLSNILNNKQLKSFYSNINGKIVWAQAKAIYYSDTEPAGYLIMISTLDERWIDLFTSTINNSKINIVNTIDQLPEISKQTIRITRNLNNYQGQNTAILNVELHLPFLLLWNNTNTADKWLMTASILVIVLFLIVFLVFWVISPLKRISGSLKGGTQNEIQPLLKGKTEMGDIARMISDYHKKTNELEASESVKQHILDQAQVGIIIANANSGIINTTNPYACKLINASIDAVIGNVTSSFLKNTETENDNIDGFESVLINTKGKEIPILRTTIKMMMDGSPVIMNTFVDLSEIKMLQNKLQDEKKKLSLAVQNSGLVFCEYDFASDDLIIDNEWNFIAKGNNNNKWDNFIENIHESDKNEAKNKIEYIMNGSKDTMATEFRIKHPDKGYIWINISILITQRDEERKPIHLIGLIDDITERINIQQELIKAKEKAEESDRMKSSYLGNMSHKIRTPLNTIVGFANLLTEEDLEAEQKNNFINIIRNDTESVLRLIDDMINLAKIDANQLDVHYKQNSLNKIMGNVADYFKANEKTNNFKFTLNTMLPDGKDTINTDPAQLEKALMNLLNNAFKFTREGEIELGYFVNPADNKLIIYVKDTGIGIPDSQKDKIFNRFYQVDPMSEGTGLGLTITESIVKMLGGKITFESEENKGSKFFIELPVNQA